MNPLETLAVELVANVNKFVTDANKGIDKVEKNATDSFSNIEKKATGSFGKVGKAIAGAVGGAAIGFAVGTLGKRFAELDKTMAGVSARAGLTTKQTDKLTGSVIKLSKANLQGQEEIALTGEALISLQGISADNVEEIERLTQKYLDFALATGQTAPDAVAAFDDILDAWNLTADDGVAIMDALVLSHQKFGTDIVGAQGALNTYASTFQTLGLDVNDALGYINLFAASGIDAEASAAAFNKAVGLLTENSDASNKKLAEMAQNLGFTNDEFEAFKLADPATQFDILTKAIAETEDPTLRAQAAIDLFGTKAGPKLAEALAGNKLEDFQISLEESAGASELAADKIQGTLINKLKLLGNEITGRAMEITRDFAPALTLIGQLAPTATSAIGGLAGALGGLVFPKADVSVPASGTQTITQEVARTPDVEKKLTTDIADKTQTITQVIEGAAPIKVPDAEKSGKIAGSSFAKSMENAASSVFGTTFGTFLFKWIQGATLKGFLAGLGRVIAVALPIAIIAALAAGLFIGIEKLGADPKLAAGIVAAVALAGVAAAAIIAAAPAWAVLAAALAAALVAVLGIHLVKHFWPELSEFFGHTLPDLITNAVTSFFTPENIGRRLADLVAIALITMFAPLVLTIHFRREIASMFELLGRLIVGGATALPGLLVGLGTTVGQTIVDVLMTEIKFPLIGGLKVWEIITGLLLPAPAAVYEFFKQGLADILVNFLGTLPSLALEGLQKTGDAIGAFFSTTLPDLLTRDSFLKLRDAVITFFGETLPNAITVEMPKIPGAVVDGLADLPGLVLDALDLVTEKVTGWITGLGQYVTDSFVPWDWIKTAALAFVDEIVGWLALIWGSGVITEWVDDLAAWLTENFQPWEWIKAAVEGLAGLLTAGLDAVVTVFVALPGRIVTGLASGLGTMALWFLGLPEMIVGWLTDEAAGNLYGKFKSAAVAAMHRFGDGITSGAGYVAQKIKDFIEDHLNPTKWDIPYLSPFLEAFEHAGQLGVGAIGKGFASGAAGVGAVINDSLGRAIAEGLAAGKSMGEILAADVGLTLGQALAAKVGLGLSGGMQGVVGVVQGAATLLDQAFGALTSGASGFAQMLLAADAGLVGFGGAVGNAVASAVGLGDAVGYTLAQYDLLAESLDKAKGGHLELVDAQTLLAGGFDTLAAALLDYDAGLITADELTQQLQTTFTEVATSAEVLGAQWTTAFADAMQRQDLLDAVGSAGVRVLDQLNLVLTEGGQKNVETLVDMVTGILDQLESELPADQAEALGTEITEAFRIALEEGTPEAIRAVVDLLDGANDAMEAGTTEVLSTVDKFNRKLGDKIADKALQDKVGRNGASLMDALDTAIKTGGAKGTDTMAQEAFDIIEAMEKNLNPGQADYLGGILMGALETALETGGEGAVQAVVDILAQIQGMIDNAPKTIPAPKLEDAPAAAPGGGGRNVSPDPIPTIIGGTPKPPPRTTTDQYINALVRRLFGLDTEKSPASAILGIFNATFKSNKAIAEVWQKLINQGFAAAEHVNWARFVSYMRTLGHVPFNKGGMVAPGAVVDATLHGGAHGEMVMPMGSPEFERVMASLINRQTNAGAMGAGGRSSRSTNYGKQYFIFGPGRQSKDVIRDLDRLLA